MDITEFNIEAGADSSGVEKIKPGRYNLEYKGADMVEGANGWKALKILFDVEGEIITISHAFTMAHDTSTKAVEIGKQSLSLMLNKMGVASIKDTDELVNKRVNAELVEGEKGYLEIKDDFGKGWAEATKPGAKPKPVADEDEILPLGANMALKESMDILEEEINRANDYEEYDPG